MIITQLGIHFFMFPHQFFFLHYILDYFPIKSKIDLSGVLLNGLGKRIYGTILGMMRS